MKLWCAECEKDVEVTEDGKCPNCKLNLYSVMERLREEDAAKKYREKADKGKKSEKKEVNLPPWLRPEEKK